MTCSDRCGMTPLPHCVRFFARCQRHTFWAAVRDEGYGPLPPSGDGLSADAPAVTPLPPVPSTILIRAIPGAWRRPADGSLGSYQIDQRQVAFAAIVQRHDQLVVCRDYLHDARLLRRKTGITSPRFLGFIHGLTEAVEGLCGGDLGRSYGPERIPDLL